MHTASVVYPQNHKSLRPQVGPMAGNPMRLLPTLGHTSLLLSWAPVHANIRASLSPSFPLWMHYSLRRKGKDLRDSPSKLEASLKLDPGLPLL